MSLGHIHKKWVCIISGGGDDDQDKDGGCNERDDNEGDEGDEDEEGDEDGEDGDDYDDDENTWGSSLREVGSPFGIKSPYPRCNPYLGDMVMINDEEFSGDNFDDFNDAGFVLIY